MKWRDTGAESEWRWGQGEGGNLGGIWIFPSVFPMKCETNLLADGEKCERCFKVWGREGSYKTVSNSAERFNGLEQCFLEYLWWSASFCLFLISNFSWTPKMQ